MSNLPLVSIVIPSLNHARHLPDALHSVLEQDYPRLELLVMDGGSTDGTLAILEGLAGRVRYVSEPDRGQTSAINRGFRIASGEVLGWLNADDMYEPSAVAAAVEYLRERPEVMLVYGDVTMTDAEGREIGPCAHVAPFDLERLVRDGDFVVQPAAFFRRAAFEAVGGLDESLHWSMDYDLWLKIGRRFPVAYHPRRWARYRWTGENKTAQGGLERLAELERVGRRHGGRGLATVFRLEKLALELREAGRRAGRGRLLSAAALGASAVAGVLASPRALKLLALGLWQRVSASAARRFGTRTTP